MPFSNFLNLNCGTSSLSPLENYLSRLKCKDERNLNFTAEEYNKKS